MDNRLDAQYAYQTHCKASLEGKHLFHIVRIVFRTEFHVNVKCIHVPYPVNSNKVLSVELRDLKNATLYG